jgi:alpha-amylase/alpha-mannosidase (GH57 family)
MGLTGRQTEIHTAEPLVSESGKIAVEKLEIYKLPSVDQILAESIQAGGKHYILRSKNLLWIYGFDVLDQLLIIYSALSDIVERNMITMGEYISYL